MRRTLRIWGAVLAVLAAGGAAAGVWAHTSAAADPAAAVDFTVAPGVVNAGATTLATATITSLGPSALTQVTATFTLPQGSTFVPAGSAAPASSPECAPSGQSIACTVSGSLLKDQSKQFFVVFTVPAAGSYQVDLTVSVKEFSTSGSSKRPPTTVTKSRNLEVATSGNPSVDARCTTSTSVGTTAGSGEVSTSVVLSSSVSDLPCNPLVARDHPKDNITVCTNGTLTCTGEAASAIVPGLSTVTITRFIPPGFPLPQPDALVVYELSDPADTTPQVVPFCARDASNNPLPTASDAATESCKISVTRSGRTYTIVLLVKGSFALEDPVWPG